MDRELVNPDPATVTVWSDIGCPWATLALHTLHARAADRNESVQVDHRAFPLELFNRMPTPRWIVDPEVVAIGGVVPEVGWRAWAGPENTYPVTLLPPMEAVQAAKDDSVGGLAGSDELDAALRRAFYVEHRCVSIPSVILDVAGECANVDADRLATALAGGAGRPELYAQWEVARTPSVQGSPHLFAVDGYVVHNPGASYHWTAPPPSGGFPRLDGYDPTWADDLLDRLGAA